MTWLEFTNPKRSSCTHKWDRVFDIRGGGAIETEWLNPDTGAAFALLSAHDRHSFRVAYGPPGTVDVLDFTGRLGSDDVRFDPRRPGERAALRDDLRRRVREWLTDGSTTPVRAGDGRSTVGSRAFRSPNGERRCSDDAAAAPSVTAARAGGSSAREHGRTVHRRRRHRAPRVGRLAS